LLFAGDHILPEITSHIGLHPQSGQDPLGTYLNSLKELMNLEVNLVFPGHGPAFSGLRQRIEAILNHHEKRKSEILKAIHDDMKTAYQVATEIQWMTDDNGLDFHDLDVRNRRLALMETLAHLEFLKKQDKSKRATTDGVYFYWT
jgi:glyoxylase-like metal-dependent hydrolase (beta-lactamase superfamily II)